VQNDWPVKVGTEDGIIIDIKAVLLKTDSSMRSNFEGVSKRTNLSILQSEKHASDNTLTNGGITIDLKELSKKVDSSMDSNCDPISKIRI
jgi:hypothetical protein